ncbi:hypothetical protein GGX14DRAFT_699745, partial [Mycena pura]
MSPQRLTALCLLGSLSLRLPSRWQKPIRRVDLPVEIWLIIFYLLDARTLAILSHVNRHFNALAVPIYLAQKGASAADLATGILCITPPDVLPVLHTAFFLPPVKRIEGMVFEHVSASGHRRRHTVSYLRPLLNRQKLLEEIHLWFRPGFYDFCHYQYGTGSPWIGQEVSRAITQENICGLLNGIVSVRPALVIVGGRMLLVSGSGNTTPWSLVPGLETVVRGAGVRGNIWSAIALLKKPKPTNFDVVLDSTFKMNGTLFRDSFILKSLEKLDVVYASSPGAWTVTILNQFQFDRLVLHSALTAADWAYVLPLLYLPHLRELNMGVAPAHTTPTTPPSELLDVAIADLHDFIARHTSINRLHYAPRLPSAPLGVPSFSLTALRNLTHLVTTPAHLIILCHEPGIFRTLRMLSLFSPTSMLVDRVKQDFMTVLGLLTVEANVPGLSLQFPAAWLAPPPHDLAIHCIDRLIILGCDHELDVRTLVEFTELFADGFVRVELYDTQGQRFENSLRGVLPRSMYTALPELGWNYSARFGGTQSASVSENLAC